MSLFSSRRERRLWLWSLAVVVAIYATLGLTGTLAEWLREHGFLDAAVFFLLGMFLVGATIVTQGVRVRIGKAEIAVVMGVVAAYLMVFTRMAILEERSHLIEYGVLGVFIYEALSERARQGRQVPLPPVVAAFMTAALGVIDEGIQWFLPTRVFDPQDIVFNLLAGTMAIGAVMALSWARRRASRTRGGT